MRWGSAIVPLVIDDVRQMVRQPGQHFAEPAWLQVEVVHAGAVEGDPVETVLAALVVGHAPGVLAVGPGVLRQADAVEETKLVEILVEAAVEAFRSHDQRAEYARQPDLFVDLALEREGTGLTHLDAPARQHREAVFVL